MKIRHFTTLPFMLVLGLLLSDMSFPRFCLVLAIIIVLDCVSYASGAWMMSDIQKGK